MSEKKLFNIIGESPFKALILHMKISHDCSKLLEPFFQAIIQQSWDEAVKIDAKITSLESSADNMKQEMRLNLHKGLYLPVPRVEILGLIKVQDRIPNLSQDIAGIIIGRNMIIPVEIQPGILNLLTQSIQASALAKQAVNELSYFFASGFSNNISEPLEKMLQSIATMEHTADEYEKQIRQQMLLIEKQIPPIDAMFLYKIITLIGEIADAAESIGDRISLLLAQ